MNTGEQQPGIRVNGGNVPAEWIDFNGHMNVAYYVLAFDQAVDTLWERFGLTPEHIEQKMSSTFAVECHVLYKQELKLDDPWIVTSQILAFDEKRIHQFQRMYHARDGFLAATAEWLNLHVDLQRRRVAPWPEHILEGIESVAKSQQDWPWPDDAGSTISVARPLWSAPGGAS